MQLLQIRSFNEFFQDTFAFLKQNGKHYFKHYFVINGFFLVLLAGMSYVFVSFYLSAFSNAMSINTIENSSSNPLDSFMNDNFGLFIIGLVVFFITALISGIVSYAYTPIYLRLYNENEGTNFSTKAIVNSYKINISKLLLFILIGILIGIPLLIAVGIGVIVLTITIVGILLIPSIVGLVALLYNSTLLEYLDRKRNFVDSMGYSWSLIASKILPVTGCVGIFFLIVYIFQIIIQVISSIFVTAKSLTVDQTGSTNPFDMDTSTIIITSALFIIQFVFSVLLNNVIQINQGIIYFSLKEEKENINTKTIIDQIGSSEN